MRFCFSYSETTCPAASSSAAPSVVAGTGWIGMTFGLLLTAQVAAAPRLSFRLVRLLGRGARRSGRCVLMRQAPDIRGDHADLRGAELFAMHRHLAVLAVVDHVHHRLLARAVQPDVVGEVGRADRLVALAVGAVA